MNAINLEHNHEQDEKKVERQQLPSQVKRKATDDLTSRPSKIIRTELHKFADKLIGSRDVFSIAQSPLVSRGQQMLKSTPGERKHYS